MEIWKDIKDYEGLYQVSNLGNVKSLSKVILKKGKYPFLCKETILKKNIDFYGYVKVVLRKNNVCKTIKNHQLVAIAFLNHTQNKNTLVVNHINFIRNDNRVENLEIVTNRENTNKKHLKSTSEYVGVSWYKNRKKWLSKILYNKKKIHLGYFNTEIEAHEAYQNKLKSILNEKNQ